MNLAHNRRSALLVLSLFFLHTPHAQPGKNNPRLQELSRTFLHQDSLFFRASLTTFDIKTVEAFLSADFEFYHDNGYGQSCSIETRSDFIANLSRLWQKNKADGVTMRRELVSSNIQLFPSHKDEAMQLGVQRFYIRAGNQPERLVETSKFSRLWQIQNGQWKMAHELDYLSTSLSNPQDASAQVNSGSTTPVSPALYNEIAQMDKRLFDSFNAHDADQMKQYFTDDLEFYHDLSGLTNFNQNMEMFKSNFAKVPDLHRELVPGSLEVYPVKDYGAMEIGIHRFCNKANGQTNCGTYKFVMIWQKKDGQWKVSRVISYGH